MKRLYLLRHGQTEFNVKKLVQGRCDSPLTDLGRKQAGMAAAWLKATTSSPTKWSPHLWAEPWPRQASSQPSSSARTQQSSPAKASSSAATAPSKKPPRRPAHRRLGSGRGPGPLRRRGKQSVTRTHGSHPHQYHGLRGHRNPLSSKPRQRQPPIHQGCSSRGLRAPSKTPQLRHHDLRF